MDPTSNKCKKKARTKKNTTTNIETGPKIFQWIMKHQDAFDALKEALTTAPVLGYPNFSRDFFWTQMFFEWSKCHLITTGQS